jgi:branched-chain amino acid transport system ATP-binding protein
MGQGEIIAEGPPEGVMSNPAVIEAYLGGHHDESLFEDRPDVVHDAVVAHEEGIQIEEPGATATPAAAVLEAERTGTSDSAPAADPTAPEEDR